MQCNSLNHNLLLQQPTANIFIRINLLFKTETKFKNKYYLCKHKTKPDSLTSQGLPGINTAKIVLFYEENKFWLKKVFKRMKYEEFQNIISAERLNRYLVACCYNTRKAMSLYRLNLHLSQEVFTLLSCFEVALRNAINQQLTSHFGENWLRDAVSTGGIFDIASCRDSALIIRKAFNRLNKNGNYTHHKLLAEMEFGVWKYMFANPQFRATGQILLRIFPNKPRSSAEIQYNNTFIFNKLNGINILRNRIAHHEPICFALKQPQIATTYILNAYQNLHKLFLWMGINSHSLLYGLDHVRQVCKKINSI